MATPDITQQQQQVIADLNANNFGGAWNTALSTSPLFGTNYGSQTTDPLLKALESSQGLKGLDPSKQWTPQEIQQFYQALQSNPVYSGQNVPGMGGGRESLGQNPYGLWGGLNASGDAAANIAQAGGAPDVGRFAGARPGKGGFFENPINDIAVAGLLAGGAGALGAFGGGAAAAGGGAAGAGALDTAVTGADIGALTGGAASLTPDLAAAAPGALDLAGAGAGLGGAADAGLGELAVTAPSLAGGGVSGGDIAALTAGAGAGALAAGGGGASPSAFSGPITASLGAQPGAVTDIGQTLDTGQNFLSANDFGASFQPVGGDMAQALGLDNPTFDPTSVAAPDFNVPIDQGSMGGDLMSWLKNPKNAATAGMLGLSLKNSLTQPKLPGALGAAGGNATALGKSALPVTQSGGTATPAWASQKASIDATINNEIQQQSQAIQQAAANSGEGNQNSGIVQQQIAEMTRQANLNRQQLYTQAQQQNVQQAIAELSGSDATLTAIGNTQLQQSEQAQALASQTAELALLLGSGANFGNIFGPG